MIPLTTDYEVCPGMDVETFANTFLSTKPILIESFCNKEGMTTADFAEMVEETLVEWELTCSTHRDYTDAARHLINHIRIKNNGKRNNTFRQVPATPGSYSESASRMADIAGEVLRITS